VKVAGTTLVSTCLDEDTTKKGSEVKSIGDKGKGERSRSGCLV
jgi:hypothetical protein